jgi:hypothetical protein
MSDWLVCPNCEYRVENPVKVVAIEEEVEKLIDACDVSGLLDAISDVCYAKAEHLETNWQDSAAAARWQRVAIHFQAMKESSAVKGVIPRR